MPPAPKTTLEKQLLFALQNWHKSLAKTELATLRVVNDSQQQHTCTQSQALRLVLERALIELHTIDPKQAKLLRLRYEKGEKVERTAAKLIRSKASFYRDHSAAIAALARILQAQEDEAQQRWQQRQHARLEPATYNKLFGVDTFRQTLQQNIEQETAPHMLLLAGLGGIGKTALADAYVRDVIQRSGFSEIAWVTARRWRLQLHGRIQQNKHPALSTEQMLASLAQQLLSDISLPHPLTTEIVLPPLQARLRERPHLVIIDNLETLTDIETLIPTLRQLIGPTKFLLTSRYALPAHADIFHLAVPSLDRPHALALLRHDAAQRNLPAVASASDSDLIPIFDTVGGNPLALRLVVGQLRNQTPSRIITNLQSAQGSDAKTLFAFIYRLAWDQLDATTRTAFLALPFAPSAGSTFEHLAAVCNLSFDTLHQALTTLVDLNLVIKSGTLDDMRYSIHSLTRTFLLEQANQWPHP